VRTHLLQIKSVPGIKGCAVLDLGRRELHPMLPAAVTNEFMERLTDRLVRLAGQMQPGEQAEFRFSEQACVVRRLVRGVLYVQGKLGFDADTLQLALKASASAIDRKLQSAQSQRALGYDFSRPEYMDAILQTFTICGDHFKSSLGHTLVVKRMQKAKENVASLFPIVNDLVVDQNGRVYPRKGRALDLDATANEAFARWLAGFINLASSAEPGTPPVNVRDLTKSIAQPLEDSNFYGTLTAVYH
jgi:hypothetical protein